MLMCWYLRIFLLEKSDVGEGIVSQTIMLSAVEKGYGGCMIGSCKRVEILEAVELDPQRYSLALVLALGKPKEEVRMVPVGEDGSTTYYRDENQVHYVPKRALEDIMVRMFENLGGHNGRGRLLHFGKEISDMMVKHISIEVTSKQTKKPVFGGPADLTAYILEPVDGILDKKRPAVLLCPGGGYRTLSTREDQPIAMKYLAAGFHVFVLHYSLAPDVFPRALMELALAMKVIREHGDEWNVDVDRIAVSGFSAGGHLACCLGVFWDREWLYGALGVKPEMIRPDGMILCYPVITSGEYCHKESFECLMELRLLRRMKNFAGFCP